MALTRDFRETVQARVRSDREFRRGLLSDAIEVSAGGRGGFGPRDSARLYQCDRGLSHAGREDRHPREDSSSDVRPQGQPTAANLFNIIACLQEYEGVRLQVVA